MKYFILCLALLAQLSYSQDPVRAEDSVWMVSLNIKVNSIELETKDDKTYTIKEIGNRIPFSSGSAFFVSPTELVSNFHVIDAVTDDIEVLLEKDDEILVGKVKKVSAPYDLSLIEVSEPQPDYLIVNRDKAPVDSGESYFLIGYPSGDFNSISMQFDYSELSDRILHFRHRFPNNLGGSSGGAIVNSKGEVVGVNYAGGRMGIYQKTLGISTSILRPFLEEVKASRDCYLLTISDCIDLEWEFLQYSSERGYLLASDKLRLGGNPDYDGFIERKRLMYNFIVKLKLHYAALREFAFEANKVKEDPNRDQLITQYESKLKKRADELSEAYKDYIDSNSFSILDFGLNELLSHSETQNRSTP